MHNHIVTRTERNILASLKRWHPTVPLEVLAAEARYRLEAAVLKDNEGGETQSDIATRLGYSLSQVERIVRTAKLARKVGKFPPLAVWLAKWRVEVETAHLRDDEVETAEPKKAKAKTDEDDDDAPALKKAQAGPAPVYAVSPHAHYRIRGGDEFIVVDEMPWLKPGDQVSFRTGVLITEQHRRSVLSIQGQYRSRSLSLQLGEPKLTKQQEAGR